MVLARLVCFIALFCDVVCVRYANVLGEIAFSDILPETLAC